MCVCVCVSSTRDGSAVELVGLSYSAVSWLNQLYQQGHYNYQGVSLPSTNPHSMWNTMYMYLTVCVVPLPTCIYMCTNTCIYPCMYNTMYMYMYMYKHTMYIHVYTYFVHTFTSTCTIHCDEFVAYIFRSHWIVYRHVVHL